jgi:hypothetical protein
MQDYVASLVVKAFDGGAKTTTSVETRETHDGPIEPKRMNALTDAEATMLSNLMQKPLFDSSPKDEPLPPVAEPLLPIAEDVSYTAQSNTQQEVLEVVDYKMLLAFSFGALVAGYCISRHYQSLVKQ